MTLRRQFVTFGAAAVTFSLAACTDASAPTAPAVSANVVALAVAPTELVPDGSGNATIGAPGHYVSTANAVFNTVSIASSGVTLDGLTFNGGGSTTAAVFNTIGGLHDVTVQNSKFSGYTGRSITFGFAEGAPMTPRGARISVIGNTIVQGGTNATAAVVFNTDGVTITGNTVTYSGGAGRRGFNVDGDTKVLIADNRIDQGTRFLSSWAIQIAMSDAEASDIVIERNTIVGSLQGIVVLSQRDVTGLRIEDNDVEAVNGIALNAGGAPPVDGSLKISDVQIRANRITGARNGILLNDRHATALISVTYENVKINGNRLESNRPDAVVVRIGPLAILIDVKEAGNKLN